MDSSRTSPIIHLLHSSLRLHFDSFLPSSIHFINSTTRPLSTDMAFILRRPFAVSAGLKQASRSSPGVRLFHNTPVKSNKAFFPLKAANPSALTKARTKFQNAFKRTYIQQPSYAPDRGNLTQKLLYGAALIGGTIVATNLIFNRETREDGGMPPFEREYLNQTFMHTGLGIGIIGLTARALHSSGWSYRLMATNPWVVIIGGLALSIGTMYGTFATPPEK
jgi:growth hormone-inducible transmembrane protein